MTKDNKASKVQPALPVSSEPESPQPKSANTVGAEEQRQRVSDSAYYRAARRGFAPGAEQDDWFEAEKDLDGPR